MSSIEHFADSPSLLVLDNLEQVVAVAPELDQLLAACPVLKILATSRAVLRLRAEREYPVAALSIPAFPAPPSIAEASLLPAVQLFVDRAQAVRYDFELTDDNAAAVVEICRRLDGLPLAIELAAARIRLLDPVALLARLENVLDALGTGPVDLPERQRSLRATIEWSVGLLDEGERNLMAALSVFVDGWTVAAAATVAELTEDRALDLLDALAGHSLVGVVATAAGPRFRMLATVREFAGELLDADGDRDRIERRHAEFFRSLVEEVHWPTERQTDWVDRLRVDEENIRAAVQWFFAHDVTALPHLFRVLWLFWQMGDRMPEGRQWIDQLRLRADELADGEQAELLFNAAVTAVEVGDDDSALAAVEAIRRLGWADRRSDARQRAPARGLVDAADPRRLRWRLAGGEDGAGRTPALERPARVVRPADRRHARDDAGPGRQCPRPPQRGRRARFAVRQQLARVERSNAACDAGRAVRPARRGRRAPR